MDEFRLDEALIVNGDSFLGGSLSAMLTPLNLAGGELMRIATVKVLDRARFGGIELDAAHHVTAFLEKGQSGPGLINAGLYRLHRSALEFWGPGPFSIETQLLPFLVRRRAVYSAELSGPFIDIGIPVDYHLFDTHFRDYINKS
jgi:D-glycero-alpha-D-manno-heptose 1-phosphate guanylyltransferase